MVSFSYLLQVGLRFLTEPNLPDQTETLVSSGEKFGLVRQVYKQIGFRFGN